MQPSLAIKQTVEKHLIKAGNKKLFFIAYQLKHQTFNEFILRLSNSLAKFLKKKRQTSKAKLDVKKTYLFIKSFEREKRLILIKSITLYRREDKDTKVSTSNASRGKSFICLTHLHFQKLKARPRKTSSHCPISSTQNIYYLH